MNEQNRPPETPPAGGQPPASKPPSPPPSPAAARPAPPARPDPAAPVESKPLQALQEKYPHAIREVSFFQAEVTVLLKKENLVEICRFLKEEPSLRMDYLSNLCGADYPDRSERFEVVYHLFSIPNRSRINLKIRVGDKEAAPSLTSVWRTANWHEREVFDLFGIPFDGHPDLRRILLPDTWQGHPLRKEYPTKGYDRDHMKLR